MFSDDRLPTETELIVTLRAIPRWASLKTAIDFHEQWRRVLIHIEGDYDGELVAAIYQALKPFRLDMRHWRVQVSGIDNCTVVTAHFAE